VAIVSLGFLTINKRKVKADIETKGVIDPVAGIGMGRMVEIESAGARTPELHSNSYAMYSELPAENNRK
jgi:hypothetical protein